MFIDGSTCQTAPAQEAAPLCNNVQNVGSWVRAVLNPGDAAPVGPGGTLADGIYQATALEGYRGAADTEVRDTVAITNGGTVILWAGQARNPTTGAITTNLGNLEHLGIGSTIAFDTSCGFVALQPFDLLFTSEGSFTTETLPPANGQPIYTETFTRVDCAPGG